MGTQTRDDGEFVLAGVPAGNPTILVRRIGFSAERRTVAVRAGQTTTLDVPMRATAVSLEQVVVTGTAAPTTKRALGTSVGTVGADAIEKAQALTIDAALQGKIAGAQITQNSGNPGGGGISVRLRGTSSIVSGAEPLYVVDGVIVDNSSDQLINLGARSNVQNRLADIDPNDIERIEIIRGAAAAALYGSRANNGVVQIFTKRGRPGVSRFTFQSKYSTSEVAKTLPMNLYPFDANGQPVTRFDYQDFFFQRAPRYENYLSFEGGTQQTQYYLGGSWSDEEGIMPESGASRRSVRMNLTQQLFPALRISAGANFVNSQAQFDPNGESTTGILTSLVFTPTDFSLFRRDGIYPFPPLGAGGFANPFMVIEQWDNPQVVNRFVGSFSANFTPLDRLTMSYTVGYDGYQMEVNQYIPPGSFPPAVGNASRGVASAIVRDSRILNNDGVATLTYGLGDELDLGTSVGFNFTSQRLSTIGVSASDLLPTGTLVSAGAIPGAPGQGLTELATLGFYTQQTASWRERLYLNAAIRADASSTFGADERWQYYPKLSLSYVISDEPSFRDAFGDVFSSFRLRSAVGYAGNQPSTGSAYARYDNYGKAVNSDRVGLVNSTRIGNPNLKPERQREFEIGADVSVLDNRVSLEATAYDKLVTDLLLSRPVNPSSGYSTILDNIGTMTNRGVELLARSVNVDRPDFRWETTVTYTRNRNKVVELNGPPFFATSGYFNMVREGEPVGVFYGRHYLHNADGSIQLDSLGRPKFSNDSVKVIGDPNPDWLGSVLNEVQLRRNLRARVLFDGSFGNDVMNLSRRILDIFGTGREAERQLLPLGDPRRLPAGRAVTTGFLGRRGAVFEEYVEDGSFVKLREVSLTYSLPNDLARRFRLSGVDLSVAGRNLYTWTDYTGYDPELNLFGQNTVERGNDFATYPIPRTFTFSARVTY